MNRLRKYSTEAIIGIVLAGLIFVALVATVGTVPFIYQGY
jgi:adenine/guanine phosphoribosyltransferase-like PRPP-binding protein